MLSIISTIITILITNQVTITTHVFSRPGGKRFVCLNSLIKIQLLTIVQACGKHLCGLVVRIWARTKSFWKDLLDPFTQEEGSFLCSLLERLVLLTQEEGDSFLFHSQYILCLFSCKDIVVSNSCYCLSQKWKSRKESGANLGEDRSSLCYLAQEKGFAPFPLFLGRTI